MSLEVRLILIAVVMAALTIGIVAWDFHERNIGGAKCEQADTKEADKQLAAQAIAIANYQKQLEAADARHADDLRLINMAATATPELVCHETVSRPVPKVPAASGGEPPAPRDADPVPERSFDPGPAVHALSIAYERRVETARDALERWPK